jgi:predicted trehalose synthase
LQKALPLVANQFLSTNNPSWIGSTSRFSFFRVDTSESAPLPHSELGFAEHVRDLGCRVPILHSALSDKKRKRCFDPPETFEQLAKPFIETLHGNSPALAIRM